ncbi:prephenate dehydratase [Parvibium lacunae]|uniref:Bifunctional chorismate mutase/prephenate dehydratase n=1 Tax=Parvibium lacunae TaxID=1888893 RepID=A0A368L4V7_9BURK|nr:prephenate dehydratase [Parvibium lacunae]RCS58513.1 prephenate dehydratase [Parvibium lacunae]
MSDGWQTKLSELRVQIDAIDQDILRLLAQRAQVAEQVGQHKAATQAPVFRPEREAQVIARLRERNPGPLHGEHIETIFREIMSACRALEQRMFVAYLGPAGTFSEQAVFKHFGQSVELVPCATIDEVFRAVAAGTADFGVVPVENSTEGVVNRTLDLFLESPLLISGEIALPIHHNVLTQSGTMQGVQKVCAHQQALAQCNSWLNQHYPQLERVAVASNAEAARLASLDATVAGIAGEQAAARYNLQFVARHVQDDPHNRTRFAVIGQHQAEPSGQDHTSLILSVANKAGAVHALLAPLAKHQVSMTRFESRPARTGSWEYYFFMDIEGHQAQPQVQAALAELQQEAAYCKVLGSYPVKTLS